jgi:hypothetical protein
MSLVQKAIRRGRKDLALQAAATLLHGSAERLWRRLGCIAFEDVGVADIDIVAVVTAALAGKRYREELGGEWRVASFVVSKFTDAPKCRASDDLLLVAESHPDFEDARFAFAFRSVDDLIRIATGIDPLPIRAPRSLVCHRHRPASVSGLVRKAGRGRCGLQCTGPNANTDFSNPDRMGGLSQDQ